MAKVYALRKVRIERDLYNVGDEIEGLSEAQIEHLKGRFVRVDDGESPSDSEGESNDTPSSKRRGRPKKQERAKKTEASETDSDETDAGDDSGESLI